MPLTRNSSRGSSSWRETEESWVLLVVSACLRLSQEQKLRELPQRLESVEMDESSSSTSTRTEKRNGSRVFAETESMIRREAKTSRTVPCYLEFRQNTESSQLVPGFPPVSSRLVLSSTYSTVLLMQQNCTARTLFSPGMQRDRPLLEANSRRPGVLISFLSQTAG